MRLPIIFFTIFITSISYIEAQYFAKMLDFQGEYIGESPRFMQELENGDLLLEMMINEPVYGHVGLRRLDAQGNVIWEVKVDSINNVNSAHTVLMNNNTILTSGMVNRPDQEPIMRFVNYDLEGNYLSQFDYGFNLEQDRLFQIHKLAEGFIAIVDLGNNDDRHPHLIRFNEDYTVAWEHTYQRATTYNQFFIGTILEDSVGNIYAAGPEYNGYPYTLPMAMKLNSEGEELWRFYETRLGRNFPGLIKLQNDEIITYYELDDNEHDDLGYPFPNRVVKLSPSGEEEWSKNLYRKNIIKWNHYFLREDGTIVTFGFGHGREYHIANEDLEPEVYGAYAQCFDEDFNSIWERFFIDNRTPTYPNSFIRGLEAQNGDLVFVGDVFADQEDGSGYQDDLWLVRTDSEGCLEPNCGFLQIIDEDGNYSTITATEDIQQNPDNPYSVLLSPNPAVDKLNIKLLGEQPRLEKLELINAEGRILKTYVVEYNRELGIDLPDTAHGICYLRGYTDVGVWTKKVVIQK